MADNQENGEIYFISNPKEDLLTRKDMYKRLERLYESEYHCCYSMGPIEFLNENSDSKLREINFYIEVNNLPCKSNFHKKCKIHKPFQKIHYYRVFMPKR